MRNARHAPVAAPHPGSRIARLLCNDRLIRLAAAMTLVTAMIGLLTSSFISAPATELPASMRAECSASASTQRVMDPIWSPPL